VELTYRQVGDDVIVIALVGELDMVTTPQARAYLQEKTAARPQHLVLDLSGVAFMGVGGLRLLIDALQGRDGIQGELHLTGVASNWPVERVLDLTGSAPLFDVYDDQDELVRKLAG
jgi:anti-sigma B factor antagonist